MINSAQEIIDDSNFQDNLSLFYPGLAAQQQADFNITKILRNVNGN